MTNVGGEVAHSSGYCNQCGTALVAQSLYCPGCGTALGAQTSQDEPAPAQETAGMGLMTAWGSYAGALLALFVYIAIGVVMSRVVMRRMVQWHPMYDTLYNVTSAKLGMVALWPLQMGSLLFRLTVNKVL
jgi:energy-converting hydrogenase Eha subunit E